MGNLCSKTSSSDRNVERHTSTTALVTTKNPSAIEKQDTNNNLAVANFDSFVLGGDYVSATKRPVSVNFNPAAGGLPMISLLPHQHTLFCERKQRVCTAVGKCQELETLKVSNLNDHQHTWIWFRSQSSDIIATKDKSHAASVLPTTLQKYEYILSKDDVGCYIGLLYGNLGVKFGSFVEETEDIHILQSSQTVGVVLPGPPRIVEFIITGEMMIGKYAFAQANYIGGLEGRSEYWWMRIGPDGKRTQVTEPNAIPEKSSSNNRHVEKIDYANDSRYYLITTDDLECTLKAKCRPIRKDKVQGEIFTSKSSDRILS